VGKLTASRTDACKSLIIKFPWTVYPGGNFFLSLSFFYMTRRFGMTGNDNKIEQPKKGTQIGLLTWWSPFYFSVTCENPKPIILWRLHIQA
jgi:hypothetical protein